MGTIREWMARAGGSLGWRRADHDLEEELRSHTEFAGASGAPREPGIARAMDGLRDQRALPWVEDVARDLRHAGRLLRRSPVFTIVAVVSLALGIGATCSIFSLADVLILRPLPVPDAGSVTTVSTDEPEEGFAGGEMSFPNFRDLRARAQSFDGMVAFRVSTVAVARSRDASREMRAGLLVSDDFFSVLRVQPARGRAFAPAEGTVPGRDAVVLLSDDFWRSEFGGDPSVLDGAVWMNGVSFHVVGILPASFTGLTAPLRPAFYVPASMSGQLDPDRAGLLEDRAARAFIVKGRLRPGVSRRRAQAEMASLWSGLARQFPDANGRRAIAVQTELESRIQADPWDAAALALLLGLVALVLVIACANVANLMLGRVRVRSREMAIRLAIGVSRGRLVRQLLTESVLLALIGCSAGLALAWGGIRFLTTIPVGPQVVIDPRLDVRVLAVSVAAALASAVLFGVAPARESLRTALVPSLKGSDANRAPRRRATARNVLVVSQIAMSMVLLVATGIVVDGFRKAIVLEPGFRTSHLLMMTLDPSLVHDTPEQSRAFYEQLTGRVRALPTVRSAALASAVPLVPQGGGLEAVVPEGFQPARGQDSVPTFSATVDEHYFDTMQVKISRGRGFTAEDHAGTRGVAIVNQEFASRYWPRQDPIGKRIRLARQPGAWLEIVGLTPTGKYTWVGETPTPFVYLPLAQQPRSRLSLLVESTATDPSGLAAPLREAVRALDVNQPIANLQTYAHVYWERTVKMPSVVMKTVSAIGISGLVLALVGLYGLVAYSVARRTREIGIRMAIGANRLRVLSMVLREGLAVALAGIAIGGVASVLVARVLAAALVGLGAPHPAIYVAVPAAIVALTLAATYVPARRASLIDPLVALRDE
jgi:predicted permease